MEKSFVDLYTKLNRSRIGLIKADLKASLTFATLARDTDDRNKRQRNTHNARRGYDTVRHLLVRAEDLTARERRHIDEKLGELRAILVELGEHPDIPQQ